MIHACTEPGCGLVHDSVTPQVDREIEIARINAERDKYVAQLAARTDKHVTEVEAEASVEVAEAQADALTSLLAVEAEAQADAPEEAPEEPAPSPVVVSAPIIDSGNDEIPVPPKAEEHHEETPSKRKGLFSNW
jgi:hypothetical protein